MNRLLFLCTSLSFGTLNAAPYDFTLYQGGFDQGAYVQAHFEGEDLDADGWLSYEDNEIGRFYWSFSGNDYVSETFQFELSRFDFKFSKQTTWLGDDKGEQLYAGPLSSSGFQYDVYDYLINQGIYGVVSDYSYYPDFRYTISNNLAEISVDSIANAPIPASIYLFFSGFVAVIFAKKQESRIFFSLN